MNLYKITNEEENHNDLQYQTGLNIDPVPFNPSGTCELGGIYYATAEHIFNFFIYGPWIREVTIPKGAKTYKDPDGDKWKADRVILGKRRRIGSPSVFKDLKKYIIKTPQSAYEYAVFFHKRIPELEKVIATSSQYSYYYASRVLNGRFKLGEKAIKKSYLYWSYYTRAYIKP